jgi:hypothetical protein
VAIIEKPNPVLACNVDAKKTITPVIRRISTKTPPINYMTFIHHKKRGLVSLQLQVEGANQLVAHTPTGPTMRISRSWLLRNWFTALRKISYSQMEFPVTNPKHKDFSSCNVL